MIPVESKVIFWVLIDLFKISVVGVSFVTWLYNFGGYFLYGVYVSCLLLINNIADVDILFKLVVNA